MSESLYIDPEAVFRRDRSGINQEIQKSGVVCEKKNRKAATCDEAQAVAEKIIVVKCICESV